MTVPPRERPLPGPGDWRRRLHRLGADALLAERGFDVVGLDTGFYRAGLLYHDGRGPASRR